MRLGSSSMPMRTPMVMLFRMAMLAMIACSCPIVGGEVAQPPRAMRAALPRTTVVPFSNSNVYRHNL